MGERWRTTGRGQTDGGCRTADDPSYGIVCAGDARQPWLEPALHRVARVLAGRVDWPEPSLAGPRYRRLSYDEALSLAAGLHEQGVDLAVLLARVEAFPYRNVALDWLSQQEVNAAMMVEALEQVIAPEEEAELTRFRHRLDFIFTLARIVHPGARL